MDVFIFISSLITVIIFIGFLSEISHRLSNINDTLDSIRNNIGYTSDNTANISESIDALTSRFPKIKKVKKKKVACPLLNKEQEQERSVATTA